MKRIQGEKYRRKVEQIEKNYRNTEEANMAAPQSMTGMNHLSVFSEDKFNEIQTTSAEVPKIGEIVLSSEEEAILKRNPKFAVLQNLQEHTMKEDMEKAYSLIRMELRDEDTGRDEDETTSRDDAEKQEEKEKKEKEEAARTRQVFDPIGRTYDERRRRVTDLAECSRVTLPRPLSVIREAEIENRRSLHDKIYQEYRAEKCNDKGEQENNLTWEEKKGLKSLMQRVSKGEILVMKTDKSGKMSVTTRDRRWARSM